MPASLLTDMNNGGGLEDQRALQLALDLSMFGLNTDDEASTALNPSFSEEDHKIKKSANMTECVPVPSSEHVAEIVGRQGCKIKALRAKTNTYIKTPVRGEEPVFVVTGRKEDVTAAKREIISAAEHFSQIRASRRNNGNSAGGPLPPGPPSPSAPGQVTIQVRVPYRVVGLVVGPKGATIKRIQQQTQTYIVTPSRDKEPVFEVTGSPENVEKARAEIEGHIAMRTGGLVDANTNNANHAPGGPGAPSTEDNHLNQLNDFHTNGIDSGFHDLNSDLLGSMYKPPSSNSAFTSYNALNHSNNILSHTSTTHHRTSLTETSNIFTFPAIHNVSTNKLAEFALSNGFTNNHMNGLIYDNDEGIASPTFDPAPRIGPIPIWPDLSRGDPDYCVFGLNSNRDSHPQRSGSLSTPRLSPTLTDSNGSSSPGVSDHDTVRRINSDPLSNGLAAMTTFAPLPHGSSSPESSTSASPTDSGSPDARRRHCMVCTESEVVAALVPCGHNFFCMECANLIVEKPENDRRCPVCQQLPSQAIRIFS